MFLNFSRLGRSENPLNCSGCRIQVYMGLGCQWMSCVRLTRHTNLNSPILINNCRLPTELSPVRIHEDALYQSPMFEVSKILLSCRQGQDRTNNHIPTDIIYHPNAESPLNRLFGEWYLNISKLYPKAKQHHISSTIMAVRQIKSSAPPTQTTVGISIHKTR